MESVIDLIREQNPDVLKRGSILIDTNDPSDKPRLLFFIEDSIQDGHVLPNGQRRVISKQLHFVEPWEDGSARNAGYAPYLDYRAAEDAENTAVQSYLSSQRWLTDNVETKAMDYAIGNIVPVHYQDVKQHRVDHCNKVAQAVKDMLINPVYMGAMASQKRYYMFKAGTLGDKKPDEWIIVEGCHEPIQSAEEQPQQWINIIKDYTNIEDLDAETLNRLVKKIVVHEEIDDEQVRHQKIEIYFNFQSVPLVDERTPKEQRTYTQKQVYNRVMNVDTGDVYVNIDEASASIHRTPRNNHIRDCCEGKCKSAYGYHWRIQEIHSVFCAGQV